MAGVLILEDDTDCRELLCEILSASAHWCVEAGTVAELERQGPRALECDLAMLDINLGPNQPTGVDAYRWLLQHGFHGKVVFLTGHGDSDPAVSEAATIANARVLTKPVDSRQLVQLTGEG